MANTYYSDFHPLPTQFGVKGSTTKPTVGATVGGANGGNLFKIDAATGLQVKLALEDIVTSLGVANNTLHVGRLLADELVNQVGNTHLNVEEIATAALQDLVTSVKTREYLEELGYIDGIPVGTTVREHTGTIGDTTRTISLIGTKTLDGTGFELSGTTVKVSPTQTLVEKFTALSAESSKAKSDAIEYTNVEVGPTGPTGKKFSALGVVAADFSSYDLNMSTVRITDDAGGRVAIGERVNQLISKSNNAKTEAIDFTKTEVGPTGATGKKFSALGVVAADFSTYDLNMTTVRVTDDAGGRVAIGTRVDQLITKSNNAKTEAINYTIAEVGPTGATGKKFSALGTVLSDFSAYDINMTTVRVTDDGGFRVSIGERINQLITKSNNAKAEAIDFTKVEVGPTGATGKKFAALGVVAADFSTYDINMSTVRVTDDGGFRVAFGERINQLIAKSDKAKADAIDFTKVEVGPNGVTGQKVDGVRIEVYGGTGASTDTGGIKGSVTTHQTALYNTDTTKPLGLTLRHSVLLDANGYVSGFVQSNSGVGSASFTVISDKFAVVAPGSLAGTVGKVPFVIDGPKITLTGDVTINGSLVINGTIHGGDKLVNGSVPDSKIIDLNGAKLLLGSVEANKIKVHFLDALTANVGNLTGGIIRNSLDTFRISLDSGHQTVKKGGRALYSGLNIGEFDDIVMWFGPDTIPVNGPGGAHRTNGDWSFGTDGVIRYGDKPIDEAFKPSVGNRATTSDNGSPAFVDIPVTGPGIWQFTLGGVAHGAGTWDFQERNTDDTNSVVLTSGTWEGGSTERAQMDIRGDLSGSVQVTSGTRRIRFRVDGIGIHGATFGWSVVFVKLG